MPTLLELPKEILEIIPFGYTFRLAEARHRDQEWREDRHSIARLARTCRDLHAVFNPILYRTLILTSLSADNRMNLIRTIVSRPDIANFVEDIKLDLFEQQFPLRDSTIPSSPDTSTAALSASDLDWYKLLGHLLFPYTKCLKQLDIRCTRYDKLMCEFPQLISAQIKAYCQGKDIGLDVEGVKQLLLSPVMEQLVLSGPYITNARKLEELVAQSSTISCLTLNVVMISAETLRTILALPQHLTKFEFYSSAMRAPYLEFKKRDKHLTFSHINSALHQQRDNLDTIDISLPSNEGDLPYSIFGSLSFHDYPRLTRLSVAPEMVIGWKQCQHKDTFADKMFDPSTTRLFGDCLPHCLEKLTIYVAHYQRSRNGTGYILEVVRSVLNQKSRLYKFKWLELNCCKGALYCAQCRLSALTALDRSPDIAKVELAQIAELCFEAGIVHSTIL